MRKSTGVVVNTPPVLFFQKCVDKKTWYSYNGDKKTWREVDMI